MKKLGKIVCPLDHKPKVLMFYREEPANIPIHRFWICCNGGRAEINEKCNRWIEIDFNRKHGISVRALPKGVVFDETTGVHDNGWKYKGHVRQTPVLVVDNANN
jgi:hypothetical protein